jgi:hypothetical protein
MDEEIKHWTAKRKTALVLEIISAARSADDLSHGSSYRNCRLDSVDSSGQPGKATPPFDPRTLPVLVDRLKHAFARSAWSKPVLEDAPRIECRNFGAL